MTQELISLLASGISFGVTAALGKKVIPWLHKLKYGQTIKEIGPKWHEKKQGTPTMGGIMFIAGILLSLLICLPLYFYLNSRGSFESSYEDVTSYWVRIIAGILMAAMFGAVGFLDDYIKVVKKQNDGLTPRQKMIFMTLIAGAFLATLAISGDATVTTIPFCANDVDVGFWFYPISLIMIVGFVNAVNLTDGVDGLFKAEHAGCSLAIVDVMLPKLDGLTMISRMRERGTPRDCAVFRTNISGLALTT